MSEWELRGVARREVIVRIEAPTLADAIELAQAGRYGEILEWEDEPTAQFFFYGSAGDVWVEHPDDTYTWVTAAELPEPWRKRRLRLVDDEDRRCTPSGTATPVAVTSGVSAQ